MFRVILGSLVAGLAAAAIFTAWLSHDRNLHRANQARLTELSRRVTDLRSENNDLRRALAKVEREQLRLVRRNHELQRSIATVKATGRVPLAGRSK